MDFVVVGNPAKGNDTNNCVVISFHLAAGIPYSKADEICTLAGRKRNKGAYLKPMFSVARKKGIRFKKIPIKRMTLKKFLLKYPKGRFVVERNGHAFAIINGKIYDSQKNGERCILFNCYKFENHRIETIKKIVNKK
jgi:hypothetical protein